MENSNLVKLIKSLKKNEKRYISLELSKHKSSNNLLSLYTVISEFDAVTDELIEKKIPDKKFISQLKINKHNLYYLILDALHNFHLRSSVYGQVLNMLHQAEILLDKGLVSARNELLKKAGKLADRYELSELKLEILRQQNHEPDEAGLSLKIYNDTKKLTDKVLEENSIKYFNNRLSMYQRKVGQRLSGTQLKYIEKEMLGAINAQKFKSNTFFNQFFYFRVLSLYHSMAGRTKEAYENDMRLLNLFKENTHMSDLGIWKDRYFSALSRLITSSSLIGKSDMLPYFTEEIANSDISEKRRAFTHINILDGYMQNGEFENSSALLEHVESDPDYYHKNLGPANRTALYFNLAVLNFGLENYSRSLHWINVLINNSDTHGENTGIHNTIRILRLILYYEMKYYDVLEYELRSTYRFISNQKDLYRFDQLVLQYIKKTVSMYERGKIRKVMEQTREDLVKLSRIKTEQQTLSYFDFISWLDSKLENRRFSEIVKEKAKERLTKKAA